MSAPAEQPWSFNGVPGRMVRTTWYRLFTTDTDPWIQREMPEFLERCLDRYTSELAVLPRPSMRLDTFLMRDRDQWELLTKQAMGADAGPFLRIQRGGFASGGRALLWSIGRRDTFAITAHEGWHQYTQRAFREALPAWAEEGVAVYMEGFTADARDPARPVPSPWANLERFDRLRAAESAGRSLGVQALADLSPASLVSGGAERALDSYAQLWALLLYVRADDGRAAALNGLLSDAANGRMARRAMIQRGRAVPIEGAGAPSGADVFEAYFGPPERFEAGYRAFVARLVASDRAQIAAGKPPG
jgi:hypothetical protein